MHVVLYLTHRNAFFVPLCVFLVRVGDKYVKITGREVHIGKTVPKVLSTGTRQSAQFFLLRTDRGLQIKLFFFFNKT